MISLILFHALYGLSLPISKLLLGYSSPLFLTGLRMVGGGLIICVPLVLWSRSFHFFKKEHFFLYCKIALFIVYFKYVFRYLSLAYLSVAKMAFIMATSPFVAVLFSSIVYKEKLNRTQWLSLILGFLGVLPLLILRGKGEMHVHECMFISWPEVIAFASIVAHVCGVHFVRKGLREDRSIQPIALNGITTIMGGTMALLTAFIVEPLPTCHELVMMSGGVLLLIFLSNIVCHTFYMYLVRRYSITFITFTDFLSTFFSATYGWVFLREQFSWHYVISGIVILVALFIFYQQENPTIDA